jgi:probable rRNA maturation factor
VSNSIDVLFMNQKNESVDESAAMTLMDAVLVKLGYNNWEVSLTLCDDEYIRSLNRDYRSKDEPTDILTFTMYEEGIPQSITRQDLVIPAGDIVISLETMLKNCEYFDLSPGEELKRLLIHGLLHLRGMDHPEDDYSFASEMLRLQEDILKDYQSIEILKPL